jgi:predicted outer membrane repeat protein
MINFFRSALGLFVALLLASTSVLAGTLNTIEVTTNVDGMNEFDGQCSLREAIHNVRLGLQFSPLPGECAPGSTSMTNRIILESGVNYSLTVSGSGNDQGSLKLELAEIPAQAQLMITTSGAARATIAQTIVGRSVIDSTRSWVMLDNLTITGGNTAGGGGGAINNYAGIMAVEDSLLSGNGGSTGGAIYTSGSLSISNSQLSGNQAIGGFGGAIFINPTGSADIRNSVLLGNSAVVGGAIFNQGSLQIRDDSRLEGNSAQFADKAGGAIMNSGSGSLVIENSRFLLNQAINGDGGAIANESDMNVVIIGSEFLQNSASGHGGALYNDTAVDIQVSHSQFRQNIAGGEGGAIMGSDSNGGGLHIEHSLFDRNEAEIGGAVTAYDNSVSITHSNFFSNEATKFGGAVNVNDSSIQYSRFEGNKADLRGGAALLFGGTEVVDSVFHDNEATNDGGAIEVLGNFNFHRLRLTGNEAGSNGGAISVFLNCGNCDDELGVISQTQITENLAQELGGGLYVVQASPMNRVDIVNTTIAGNSASIEGGGGIYVHPGAHVRAFNSTFAGNLLGQDIVKMGNMTLANTIIASADQDNCLSPIANPTFTSLGHNLSNDDSCAGLDQPTDMVNTNPLLGSLANFGGNTLTLELLPGSPAIDAGDDAICAVEPVNGVDQRGGIRPAVGCDIGAHEQEFVFDSIFGDRFES